MEFDHVTGSLHLYNNNQLKVLTNEPQLPEQYAMYSELRKQYPAPPGSDDTAPATYVNFPGNYSSVGRFQRLAILNANGWRTGRYTNQQTFSPFRGFMPGKPEVIAALQIIRTVELPNPAMSSDWTQWTVVNDHTNRVLYYRSPADDSLILFLMSWREILSK